jgi:hypothetical protein
LAALSCSAGDEASDDGANPTGKAASALAPLTDASLAKWRLLTSTPASSHLLAVHITLVKNEANLAAPKILVVGGSNYNCCGNDPTPTDAIDAIGHPADGFTLDMDVDKQTTFLYDIASGQWGNELTGKAPYGNDSDSFCSGHVHDSEGGVIFHGGLLNLGKWNFKGIEKSARYSLEGGGFADLGYKMVNNSPVAGDEGSPTNYHDDNYYPTLLAGPLHTYIFPGNDAGPLTADSFRLESMDEDGARDNLIARLASPGFTTPTHWESTPFKHVTTSTYPRVHLLPDGRFFFSSPNAHIGDCNTFSTFARNYIYDPLETTQARAIKATTAVPPDCIQTTGYHGSPVLFPLKAGANGVYSATLGQYASPTIAWVTGPTGNKINLSSAMSEPFAGASPTPPLNVSWTNTAARISPTYRLFGSGVLLPTGQILVQGGLNTVFSGDESLAIREPELYDPELDQWVTIAPPATFAGASYVPNSRNYHSSALMIPDGRVWVAGSNIGAAGTDCAFVPPLNTGCDANGLYNPDNSKREVEMIEPWYHTRADRPVIGNAFPYMYNDGGTFEIPIGSSGGNNVTRVALMRAGSMTHAFDGDQRHLWLDIVSKTSTKVIVRAPFGAGAAPPGDYLLFALRNNPDAGTAGTVKRFIPSTGRWVQIVNQQLNPNTLSTDYAFSTGLASARNLRVAYVDAFEDGAQGKLNIIYQKDESMASTAYFTRADMDASQFATEISNRAAPWRVTHVDSYKVNGQARFVAVWDQSPAPGGAYRIWHGISGAQYFTNVAANPGFRLVNESVVFVNGVAQYTALYDKGPTTNRALYRTVVPTDLALLTATEKVSNRRLVYVNAQVDAGNVATLTAVFADDNVTNVRGTRFYAAAQDQSSYADLVSRELQRGRLVQAIAAYPTANGTRFATLSAPTRGHQ